MAIAVGLGGLRVEGIALRFGVQPSTVTTPIERTYATLGVHSRAQLVFRVMLEVMRLREEELLNALSPPPLLPPPAEPETGCPQERSAGSEDSN